MALPRPREQILATTCERLPKEVRYIREIIRDRIDDGLRMRNVTVDTYRDDPLYPRIVRAVDEILRHGNVVAPVDVLIGMGWVTPNRIEDWRRGRVPYLERVIRWEGRDRGRRSIEIDIVADLDDRVMLTGEIKWSSREVDHDLHLHLARDLEDLARSGMTWAKRALSSKGYHLYVSAAGFTEHFIRRAAEHSRIRLVALDDLY